MASTTASPYASVMTALGERRLRGFTIPTEALLVSFENRFDVSLPTDYRSFLFWHGGPAIEAGFRSSSLRHAAPKSRSTNSLASHRQRPTRTTFVPPPRSQTARPRSFRLPPRRSDTGSIWYAPVPSRGSSCITISSGDPSGTMPLARDAAEQGPSLQEYLTRRRDGTLPEKLIPAPDFYLLARTFDAFLRSCRKEASSET